MIRKKLSKKDVLKYIQDMPARFSFEELMDKLLLIHKIEIGLEQSKTNKLFPMKT